MLNSMDVTKLVNDLYKRPTVSVKSKKGYKKLQLTSGLAVTISPDLQSDLRSRGMIVALNGSLFPARDKQERLADEALTVWDRIETSDTAKMLRFGIKGQR